MMFIVILGGEKPEKIPGGIAPTFKEKPKVVQDPSGKKLTIECKCTANPQPNLTWYKGTTVLKEDARHKMRMEKNNNDYNLYLDIMVKWIWQLKLSYFNLAISV